jgi:hypothetical protein
MTGTQAAEAGQAMLDSARAQKDQIAQGFLAERDAVLQAVSQQQADMPTPADISGIVTDDVKEAAQAAGYSQEEIDAALKLMHANAGLEGAAAPSAAPTQAQAAPPQAPTAAPNPTPAAAAPAAPVYSAPPLPTGQAAMLQEIVQRLQLMIAAEVSLQLRTHGLVAPQAAPAPHQGAENLQNGSHSLSQTQS